MGVCGGPWGGPEGPWEVLGGSLGESVRCMQIVKLLQSMGNMCESWQGQICKGRIAIEN